VRNGVVQKKHRQQATAALGYVLDRESPARGCRHLLSKRDIHEFTGIIPGWPELSLGIESIVLTRGSDEHDACYRIMPREKTGSIEIPAWEGDLWVVFRGDYFDEHATVLELFGVASEELDDGVECRFTLPQARAFLLLHIFLHELGHHVDRMQTKGQMHMPHGEDFAERFANELCARIWPDYLRLFGDPRLE